MTFTKEEYNRIWNMWYQGRANAYAPAISEPLVDALCTEYDKIRAERGEEKLFAAPPGYRFVNEPARNIGPGDTYAVYHADSRSFYGTMWPDISHTTHKYQLLEKIPTSQFVSLDPVIITVKGIYGTDKVLIPPEHEAKFGLVYELANEGYDHVLTAGPSPVLKAIKTYQYPKEYRVCTRKVQGSQMNHAEIIRELILDGSFNAENFEAQALALHAGADALEANGWKPLLTVPMETTVLVSGGNIEGEATYYTETVTEPTHWMPLPAPPEVKAASDKIDRAEPILEGGIDDLKQDIDSARHGSHAELQSEIWKLLDLVGYKWDGYETATCELVEYIAAKINQLRAQQNRKVNDK